MKTGNLKDAQPYEKSRELNLNNEVLEIFAFGQDRVTKVELLFFMQQL